MKGSTTLVPTCTLNRKKIDEMIERVKWVRVGESVKKEKINRKREEEKKYYRINVLNKLANARSRGNDLFTSC